jgi:hypothetical protein
MIWGSRLDENNFCVMSEFNGNLLQLCRPCSWQEYEQYRWCWWRFLEVSRPWETGQHISRALLWKNNVFIFCLSPEVIWKAEMKGGVLVNLAWRDQSLSYQSGYSLHTFTHIYSEKWSEAESRKERFRNPAVCKTAHQVSIGIRRVPLLQLPVPLKRSHLLYTCTKKGFLEGRAGISPSPVKGMVSMNDLPSTRPHLLKTLSTQNLTCWIHFVIWSFKQL